MTNIDWKDPNIVREMHENPRRDVVVVGLLNNVNEIFLVRTIRFPDYWQPLGGGVSPEDKTPIDTLAREIEEEAGIIIPSEDFQFEIKFNYDFGEGEVHFYTAKIASSIKVSIDGSQIVDTRWLPIPEATKLPMFPATQNFITYLMKKGIF